MQNLGDLRGVRLDVSRTDNDIRDLVGDDRTTLYQVTFDNQSKPINILSRRENIVENISLVASIQQIIGDSLGSYDFEEWFEDFSWEFLLKLPSSKQTPQDKIEPWGKPSKNRPKKLNLWSKEEVIRFGKLKIRFWRDREIESESKVLSGTYFELRQQLLAEMRTPSVQVGEVFEGGWFGGRRGQPEIILTFWEDQEDVAAGFEKVRGRITIRIMDKTDDPDSDLPKMTWAEIRQLQQKIYEIFVLPNQEKGFVWKKGKDIVNYTDRKAGYQNNILCRNHEEGKRVVEALLAIQDKVINTTKLRPGGAYDPAQTYPTIPPEKMVLGEQRRMPRLRPIADVRFCRAVLLMQFYPGPIVLIDNRQKVALSDN